VLPTLAEFFSQGEMEKIKIQIEKAAQAMLVLTIPIAIIAAVVIFPVVQSLLGFAPSEALRVVTVTRIFLLGDYGACARGVICALVLCYAKAPHSIAGLSDHVCSLLGFKCGFDAILAGGGHRCRQYHRL